MKHTVFALFPNQTSAAAALTFLKENDFGDEHLSVVTHKQTLDSENLHIEETHAREGLIDGALLGGLSGLVAGLVLGPAGLLGTGALATLLFTTGAGSIYGVLSAGLAGLSVPDHTLEQWAEGLETGKILVTVNTHSHSQLERGESMLVQHGAETERKPIL